MTYAGSTGFTPLTVIGGAGKIDIFDMADTFVCSITNFKGRNRVGHPTKGNPMKWTVDNFQNDSAFRDFLDDYLMTLPSDTVTIGNEEGIEFYVYSAEAPAINANKFFKMITYGNKDIGGTTAQRDVTHAICILTGNTGDEDTQAKSLIKIALEITSIACPVTGGTTFAIDSFDPALIDAPAAAVALAYGSYGVVTKMDLPTA